MADIFDYIKELVKLDVEYSDEDKHYYSLKSYIKRVEEDKILIDPPTHKGRNYPIKDGTTINIVISTNSGVFSGACKVIGREISTISGLWITFPFSNKQVQRREYLRVPLKKSGKLIIFEKADKKTSRIIEFQTRDISGKGFSFVTDEPLTDYYDIECVIKLDENNEVKARCEHIYSKGSVVNNQNKFINALAFIELPNDSVDKIVRESFKYQLEMKRKGLD